MTAVFERQMGSEASLEEESEKPSTHIAKALAVFWQDMGAFDWFVTFSFDQMTHRKYRLNTPDRLYAFIASELGRFDYNGPYVIVPHDNGRTQYFHAHCQLTDHREGLCEKLSADFRRYGSVQKPEDGLIRGSGAFLYCANRALDRYTGDFEFEQRLHGVRRPRSRGHGRA